MSGSLRQRSPGAWERRVYLGVDTDSGRQRWATKTVRGSRRYANKALAEFVAEADYAKIRAGPVADLLDGCCRRRRIGRQPPCARPAASSIITSKPRSVTSP